MLPNDDLRLRLTAATSNDQIEFAKIAELVAAVEGYLSDLVGNPTPRLMLAAEPQRGSIELIFNLGPTLVASDTSIIVVAAQEHGRDLLTDAASFAGVAALVLQVAFAPWGLIARKRNKTKAPPAEDREAIFADQLAARVEAAMERQTQQLIAAAWRSDCVQVSFDYRGYGQVDALVPPSEIDRVVADLMLDAARFARELDMMVHLHRELDVSDQPVVVEILGQSGLRETRLPSKMVFEHPRILRELLEKEEREDR